MGAIAPDEHTLPNDNPHWTNAVLARAAAMQERDKNHPCVLIWSCGNESFGGSNIYAMSEQFRKRDSSRLVHYEGVVNDRRFNQTSDMESQMYPSVAKIEQFLKEHPNIPTLWATPTGHCSSIPTSPRESHAIRAVLSGTSSTKQFSRRMNTANHSLQQAAILTTVRQTIISARMALSLQTAPLPPKWQK